jgi:NAD(P)-dependent dehydrogenase (short-subunit alcohol dehydrogenase family)
MNLKGKRVIILGGSSSNGFATAKAAAEEGAHVVIGSGRMRNRGAHGKMGLWRNATGLRASAQS